MTIDVVPGSQYTVKNIFTPSGYIVGVLYDRSPELPLGTITGTNLGYLQQFGTVAKLLSNPTVKYNCHSYAWYSQNVSTNKYWVDDISNFIRDPLIVPRNSWSEIQIGDIVVWENGAHSAVVDSIMNNVIQVVSKWGEGGLYRHPLEISPYEGTAFAFYHIL